MNNAVSFSWIAKKLRKVSDYMSPRGAQAEVKMTLFPKHEAYGQSLEHMIQCKSNSGVIKKACAFLLAKNIRNIQFHKRRNLETKKENL